MTGAQCKKRRKALRLKLEILSKLSGIHVGTISRFERGKLKPSAEIVARIERALDDLVRVKKAFGGASLNFDDLAWVRAQLKKLAVPKLSLGSV